MSGKKGKRSGSKKTATQRKSVKTQLPQKDTATVVPAAASVPAPQKTKPDATVPRAAAPASSGKLLVYALLSVAVLLIGVIVFTVSQAMHSDAAVDSSRFSQGQTAPINVDSLLNTSQGKTCRTDAAGGAPAANPNLAGGAPVQNVPQSDLQTPASTNTPSGYQQGGDSNSLQPAGCF
jgi:hypothetical protein